MKIVITLTCLLLVSFSLAQDKYRNFYTDNSNDKRGIALILSNDVYKNTSNLSSAVKDGQIMIDALKEVEFDIEIGFNLNRTETLEAINSFSEKLNKYKYAFVFFSGHGVQFGNRNYLVPSDGGGDTEFKIKNSSIDIGHVLKALEQYKIPKAIILDACRENPFLSELTSETMSVKGFGLAEIKANENSIIVYSTASNTVVPDSNQFTEIFSENIKQGGCIDDILRKTRSEVKSTDPNQLIFSREALLENICFASENPNPNPNPSIQDSDGDGITNQFDKCPEEYGSSRQDGCPDLIFSTILEELFYSDGKNINSKSYYEINLDELNLKSFKIQFEFKIDNRENYSNGFVDLRCQPLLTLSQGYRHLCIYLNEFENEIVIGLNNKREMFSTDKYLIEETWYKMDIVKINDSISVFLNGNLIRHIGLGFDNLGNDKYISTHDGSSGMKFKGYLKNIFIYNK